MGGTNDHLRGLVEWRKLILEKMKEGLKPLGFRMHNVNFVKFDGERWVVVNLQSSSFNQEGFLRVFLNVGIHYGRTSQQITGASEWPKEFECHWRGRARPEKGHWDIESHADALRAAEEIADWSVFLSRRAIEAFPTPASLLAAPQTPGGTSDPIGWIQYRDQLESLAHTQGT